LSLFLVFCIITGVSSRRFLFRSLTSCASLVNLVFFVEIGNYISDYRFAAIGGRLRAALVLLEGGLGVGSLIAFDLTFLLVTGGPPS